MLHFQAVRLIVADVDHIDWNQFIIGFHYCYIWPVINCERNVPKNIANRSVDKKHYLVACGQEQSLVDGLVVGGIRKIGWSWRRSVNATVINS